MSYAVLIIGAVACYFQIALGVAWALGKLDKKLNLPGDAALFLAMIWPFIFVFAPLCGAFCLLEFAWKRGLQK